MSVENSSSSLGDSRRHLLVWLLSERPDRSGVDCSPQITRPGLLIPMKSEHFETSPSINPELRDSYSEAYVRPDMDSPSLGRIYF